MNFYNPYDDEDDDRLGKNYDWKNYKPCDDCGETFLKSDLIYVTTNNDDPSRKYMQWSEQHLTDNTADPCHSKGVSFNNCMFRVTGSINSKVNRQVTIVQGWNGIRPSINPLSARIPSTRFNCYFCL